MPRKPNILLIITDEHNPHVAGYAGNSIVDTTALDGLAAAGTQFETAYCQSPLCSPSRLSLLTGKWVSHCSAWSNGAMLNPEHETIPGWLGKKRLYHGQSGKDARQRRGPHARFSNTAPTATWWQAGLLCTSQILPRRGTAGGTITLSDAFNFAGPTEIPESLLVDKVITTESLAWLLEYSDQNPDTPWFFCASYSRPHFPLTAPGRYIRKYLASGLRDAATSPRLPG